MRSWARGLSCLLAVFALGAAPAGAASLTGVTIGAALYHPETGTPYPFTTFTPSSFVVGPGQETDGNVEDLVHLLVDFDDDTLLITFTTIYSDGAWDDAAFNGVIFTTAVPHELLTATVALSTTMAGFDDSRVSLTGNQILLNWAGLSFVDGTTVRVDFTSVPEPASALLVVGSTLPLALTRRRRV